MGYADDTTIYAVIPMRLLRPQVIESLNQDLTAINSFGLKWRRRINPTKAKSTVVIRSLTYMLSVMVISILVVLSLSLHIGNLGLWVDVWDSFAWSCIEGSWNVADICYTEGCLNVSAISCTNPSKLLEVIWFLVTIIFFVTLYTLD